MIALSQSLLLRATTIIIIALAAVLAFTWASKKAVQQSLGHCKERYRLAAATIELQQSAVARLRAEAERRAAQSDRARREALSQNAGAEITARKLEQAVPLTADCRTPSVVMETNL